MQIVEVHRFFKQQTDILQANCETNEPCVALDCVLPDYVGPKHFTQIGMQVYQIQKKMPGGRWIHLYTSTKHGGGGGGSSENFLDETLFEFLAKFDAYKSITRAKFNIHICGGEN